MLQDLSGQRAGAEDIEIPVAAADRIEKRLGWDIIREDDLVFQRKKRAHIGRLDAG